MTSTSLLNRSAPHEDESLASWMTRLAYNNYVALKSLQHHLRQLVGLSAFPSSLHILSHPQIFKAIGLLTKQPVETIYRCTLHRFAHFFALPHRHPLTQLEATTPQPLTLLPEKGVTPFVLHRFSWCPHCIREAPYVRLHWHIAPLASCAKHHCWLLRRCPQCDAIVREQAVLDGHCVHCHYDLTTAAAPAIPADSLFATLATLLMDWLYLRPVDETLGLPDAPTAVLVSILHGLRHVAQRAGDGWPHHLTLTGIPDTSLDIPTRRALTRFETGRLYTTALQGILDWPNGFFVFVSASREGPSRKPNKSRLRAEFGNLYEWVSRFWAFPEFEFLQQAFNEYLSEHIAVQHILFTKRIEQYPELLERADYLYQTHAAAYLNCSPQTVHRLLACGALTPIAIPGNRRGVWFDHLQLQTVKQYWSKQLQLGQLVSLLGLSLDPVRQLVQSPLLPANRPTRLNSNQLTVERQVFDTFLTKLRSRVQICEAIDPSWHRFYDVIVHTVFPGATTPSVLKRVFEGMLNAYHPDESCLPLSDLYFLPSEVARLDDDLCKEAGLYRAYDVTCELGINWRTYYKLLETGFVRPAVLRGKRRFFRRSDVREFHSRYILLAEMARLFHLHPTALGNRIRRHALFVPVFDPRQAQCGCYIFDREVITAWHQKHVFLAEIRSLTDELDEFLSEIRRHRLDSQQTSLGIYPRRFVTEFISQQR